MTMVHFYIKHHTVGVRRGGGAMAARYLERTGEYAPDAAQYAGYHDRSQGKWKDLDDVRWREVANLPAWADGDASRFFETAAQQERANGRWATSIQANLPRDLTREEQVTITRTWVATHLPDRPVLWVIHEPQSQGDGLPQPHVHILFSERLMNDGIARSPEQMFRRYNPQHPERGGAQKHTFGRGDRQAPYRLREAWCASMNVALEAAGSTNYMDPRSFHVRGIARQQVRREAQGIHDLETPMLDERTPETRAQEAGLAAAWWGDYKRDMGLTREHGERSGAPLRRIAREVRQPGSRTHPQQQENARHQRLRLGRPLVGNRRSKIYHSPGDPNYGDVGPGNQVLFWSIEEAEAHGYRAAVNQHYGAGAHERLMQQQRHVTRELARYQRHQTNLQHPLSDKDLARVLADGRTLGVDGPSQGDDRAATRRGWAHEPVRMPHGHLDHGRGRAARGRIFNDERRLREEERR